MARRYYKSFQVAAAFRQGRGDQGPDGLSCAVQVTTLERRDLKAAKPHLCSQHGPAQHVLWLYSCCLSLKRPNENTLDKSSSKPQ